MNPLLEKYLKDKYGENYEADAQSGYEESSGRANTGQLFSGIGEAIAGTPVGSRDSYFEARRKEARENTLGKVEKGRKTAMEDMTFGSQMQEAQAKADKRDPKSQRNMAWRESLRATVPELVKNIEPSAFENLTMEDADAVMNPVKWRLQNEAQKAQLEAMRGARADAATARKEERDAETARKEEERRQGRLTTFGEARTDDDAKVLKNAADIKTKFDDMLGEMIALREKHNGGTMWNREDVDRGKALSSDLLLAYKDLSKLGVLSQSDEKILKSIIPSDPLEYASPVAAIQGQDPTMNRMKKFKQDAERDFQGRLKQRLRGEPVAPTRDADAERYAEMHGLPYEKALEIITKRRGTKNIAGGQ